jgi:hypothetical protein
VLATGNFFAIAQAKGRDFQTLTRTIFLMDGKWLLHAIIITKHHDF